jgi:hypothetical protein
MGSLLSWDSRLPIACLRATIAFNSSIRLNGRRLNGNEESTAEV